jgi:hypothetical protein
VYQVRIALNDIIIMQLLKTRRFVLSSKTFDCWIMLLLLLLVTLRNVHGLLLVGRVPAGPTGLQISEMGCGTWSWGNRLLFDYNPNQDEEIYQAYQKFYSVCLNDAFNNNNK